MRVLYDISTLGLAHHYRQSRGGAYRVDRHLTEGLAAADDCELCFCANHSAVAYHGCEAFLRGSQSLAGVPLLGSATSGQRVVVRAAARAAHRLFRGLFGNVLPSPVRHVARLVDTRLHPPVTAAPSPIDILHTSPLAPLPKPSGGRLPKRFLTVYDLAFVRFPEIYGPAYRQALAGGLRSLRNGDHVLTTSNFVRDELAAEGIAPLDRIHVAPLAADPLIFYPCLEVDRVASVREKYGVPDGPYVLGVNTPDPRKNVPHAVHAFARVAHDQPSALRSFVLTGHPGPGSDRLRQAIDTYPALRDRIIVTGYVPDEDLAPLYTGAQVFVYNSIYEGFGLPPLEAMQCGTPVITSTTSSLPEVVGTAGVMVAPHDLDALAGALLEVAAGSTSGDERQQRALAQARNFSWARATAATLHAYRAALDD